MSNFAYVQRITSDRGTDSKVDDDYACATAPAVSSTPFG
jgi:hypothetical protein